MRRVDGLIAGEATGGAIGSGGDLLDEINKGEPTLTELADDAEAVLVDPDIAAPIDSVVESVEARERATH